MIDLQNISTSRVGLSPYIGLVSPAYIRFSPKNAGAFNRFYYYFLMSLYYNCVFNLIAENGVHSALNATDMGMLLLTSPPDEEQRIIAHFLDIQTARIDEALYLNRAQIEELRLYKQSLITETVTRGLDPDAPMKDSGVDWIGQIPANWHVIRVKQLLSERKERSVTGAEEPLSMSQKYGVIPTKDMDMVPNMALSFIGAKLVHAGDLVFNKLKAHLGVFSVSRYNGLVSPDYAVYTSTGRCDLKFLEYLFKTPQCISEFKKRSTGIAAGLTRLYTDDLFGIECPVPPVDERNCIVAFLNKKCAIIDALIALKQSKIEKLTQYRQSLIYEYVTGKKEAP